MTELVTHDYVAASAAEVKGEPHRCAESGRAQRLHRNGVTATSEAANHLPVVQVASRSLLEGAVDDPDDAHGVSEIALVGDPSHGRLVHRDLEVRAFRQLAEFDGQGFG
jgi:hypothetical protein